MDNAEQKVGRSGQPIGVSSGGKSARTILNAREKQVTREP
jgi:hypothetical protein